MRRRRRQRERERQKSNRLRLAFARASRFFVHFVAVTARLPPESAYFHVFGEDVNKVLRNFLSLSEIGYGF